MQIKYLALLMFVLFSIGSAFSQSTTGQNSTLISYDLTGQVVDSAGFGITGATVWIIGNGGSAFNATTNRTGYYGFNAPPGSYNITAQLPGFSFTSAASQVQPGTSSVAPRIMGYPAAAAAATGANAAPANINATNATTANATLPSGFNLYPSGSAYSSSPANPSSLAYYTGTSGAGWVQGRIVDQSGAAIPFAGIGIDGSPASESTDAQGNYRIALGAGMHTLEPMKQGYGIPPRVIFITPGNTTNFDLTGSRTIVLG